MATFDDFKQEWLTRRIDYDHTLGYQCVDIIRQYFLECFGLSGGGGVPTAIAYWTSTPGDVLAKFSKVSDGSVQKGDVVILRTLGHADYAGDGHIGIATGNGDPNSVEILEQNGQGSGTGLGQDAIRTRFIPRNRLAGVLRPIPVAPTPKYQVTETYPQGRQIRLNKQPTNLWGMNYDFDTMSKNPVEVHNAGEVWTVTNKVHHIDGYDYYRRDGQVDGFNVADCDDYTPPPPPVAPQVINTPNVAVNLAEKYTVITKLMVFPTAVDAKSLSNYTGTDLEPGVYKVFSKDNNAYNLTTNNVQNQNKWVRITDNVVKAEPTPEPVQPTLPVDAPATDITLPVDVNPNPVSLTIPLQDVKPAGPKPQYNWIRDDRLPVRLTSTNSTPVPIHDLEGKYPTQSFPAHRTEDYSMFTVLDNVEYWLPDRTRNKGWMYAVPLQFLPEEPAPTLLDHNGNGKYDIVDLFDNGIAGFVDFGSKYLDGIKRAVTVVAPKIEPAKQRIGKTIDGFSSRKGKK